MALRLVKNLRKSTIISLPTRGRPAASEEIVEPPHDYYIVKDYDRNPFYMSIINAAKPGYKKDYDPFKKYSERREIPWEPKYKNHQLDISLGWFSLAFFFFLPIQFFILMVVEGKSYRYYKDPLSFNFGKPSEF